MTLLSLGPAWQQDNERRCMLGDTSKFKVQDIVSNKGGFAVARGSGIKVFKEI
jgi:hypothetical protein